MVTVVLREVVSADAQWIFEACQDVDIQRWTTVPRPYLFQHAEGFCRGEGAEEKVRWAIMEQDSKDRGLGLISIHTVKDGVAEIGYWVAPWARGIGVCTTAVELLTEYAKGLDEIQAISARVASTNAASQRVMEKSGFVAVGATEEPLPDGELKVPGIVFQRRI